MIGGDLSEWGAVEVGALESENSQNLKDRPGDAPKFLID